MYRALFVLTSIENGLYAVWLNRFQLTLLRNRVSRMNSPLLNFQFVESENVSLKGSNTAKVFSFKPAANTELLTAADSGFVLAHFKTGAEQDDRKLLDYLILGVLSIVIHASVVDRFKQTSVEQEIIEPVKIPPKVQINLLRPQPKPVVQPPPPPKAQAQPQPQPVPKAVPLKPKPRVKPKPVEKRVEPPPIQQPVQIAESKAPVTPTAPVVQLAPPPVVEKVTEPKAGADYLNNPSPEYPEAAMDRGLEGKVLMKVHVQPDGKPDSVTVSKSSGHTILDDAAVRTVKQWSFVPAMRGKTPIAGWVTVPIAFNLQN